MDVIEIRIAAQRLLLLQLYKQCFLANPDARSQLAIELLGAIELTPSTCRATGTIDVPRQDALKRELENFFANVEHLVAEARHQQLIFPPA